MTGLRESPPRVERTALALAARHTRQEASHAVHIDPGVKALTY
jgi:hypothetical protein